MVYASRIGRFNFRGYCNHIHYGIIYRPDRPFTFSDIELIIQMNKILNIFLTQMYANLTQIYTNGYLRLSACPERVYSTKCNFPEWNRFFGYNFGIPKYCRSSRFVRDGIPKRYKSENYIRDNMRGSAFL